MMFLLAALEQNKLNGIDGENGEHARSIDLIGIARVGLLISAILFANLK